MDAIVDRRPDLAVTQGETAPEENVNNYSRSKVHSVPDLRPMSSSRDRRDPP